MTDLLIAGGGPAGAALAVFAGRAGYSVSLFEAARFPREKPCGEGVMPSGVGVLERLGLAGAIGGRPLHGVRYHGFGVVAETGFPCPRGPVSAGVPAAHGLGQRRFVLDDALLRAARATPNVQVVEGVAVQGVARRAGRAAGLIVDGQVMSGRLIVGADGYRSGVRTALDLDAPAPRHRRWGARVHFRLAPERALPPEAFIEVFVGAGHELYLTPLPAGEVLVAALSARSYPPRATPADDGKVMALAAEHPALMERLRGATLVSPVRGRSPLACRARAGVAPGAVLLGDAAGFIDPITGGGIAQALLSAELLARFLPRILTERDRGDNEWLWRFDRRRRAMLRDYQWLTAGLLLTTRSPGLARATLHLMRARPGVLGHLVGVAAGLRHLTS